MQNLPTLRRYPLVRLGTFLFLTAVSFSVAQGQTSPQCPPVDRNSWDRGTVQVTIDPNMPQAEQDAIRSAIAKWNTANQSNGSGVVFTETPTAGASTLTFQNGTNPRVDPNTGQTTYAAGRTSGQVSSTSTPLTSATITFDPTLRAGVDPNDAAGFSSIMEKLTLHEMGHTMGLGHPSQETAQASVMNDGVGVNDSSNNQSIEITQCDQGAVSSESKYQPTPTPTPTPTPRPPRICYCPVRGCETENCYMDDFCHYICNGSPVLVDVNGDGFDLTDGANGVQFDLDGDGTPDG